MDTDSLWALRKSIPKIAIWTSVWRKVHLNLKNWPDSFSCTWHSPQHLIGKPVGHYSTARSRKAGRMGYDAESCPYVHQKMTPRNLIHHVDQKSRGNGIQPAQGLWFPDNLRRPHAC
jgi:hypothetical protein